MIDLNLSSDKYTSKDDILSSVKEILSGNEKRFEIDL